MIDEVKALSIAFRWTIAQSIAIASWEHPSMALVVEHQLSLWRWWERNLELEWLLKLLVTILQKVIVSDFLQEAWLFFLFLITWQVEVLTGGVYALVCQFYAALSLSSIIRLLSDCLRRWLHGIKRTGWHLLRLGEHTWHRPHKQWFRIDEIFVWFFFLDLVAGYFE